MVTTNKTIPITEKTTYGIKSARMLFTAPMISKMETIAPITLEMMVKMTTAFAPKKMV